MSKAWASGSTSAWRKTRAYVLQRDNYLCKIRGPKCLGRATQVDHILGKKTGDDPTFLRAACQPCNGGYDPNKKDPEPRRGTRW